MALVPMVVQADGGLERSFDIYSRLLRERIVFLGREVDDELANVIAAQLLVLEAEDPEKDISLYINSPGGSAYAGMAIYDAMQYVKPDVQTVCIGMGMSAAAMILAAGAPGKRFVLPNAKVMIHQGSGGFRGTPADIQIAAREIQEMTRRMAELIARHSGQEVDQVMQDIDRDRFMAPEEAVAYGLVDEVLERRPCGGGSLASPRWRRSASTTSAWPSPTSTRRSRPTGGSSAPSSSTAISSPSRASRPPRCGPGGSRVELLAPTVDDSPVGKFLARRGPGMHHVAYEVDDIGASLAELAAAGAELIDSEPRRGLFGLQVAFVHPDSVHGVLTEVVSRV